ncbi:MAG: ComEC/Rec2 family competence protein [bacterium]|nr:ComEC/Rec2 family competence protein [bacterium]
MTTQQTGGEDSMRLVYGGIAWCGAIVWAAGSDIPSLLIITALVSGAALWIVSGRFEQIRHSTSRGLALLSVIGCAGMLRFQAAPAGSDLAAYNNRGGATLEGIVIAPPVRVETETRLRLAAETIYQASRTFPTSGVALVDAANLPGVQIGDRVRVTGDLLAPSRYGNFSYAGYLERSGVYSIMPFAAGELIQPAAENPFMRALMAVRAQTADHIARALPEPEAGLLMGILLGDESGLSQALERDFAATGAAHVIAISGFNMVVVSGIVTGALARLRVPKGRAVLIALAAVGLYTLFVGATPPILRAALMSGLLIVGRGLRRSTFVPASLAFGAVIISALNPLALWDIGFQLSFAAVMGIALLADPLSRAFERLMRRIAPARTAERLIGWLNEPLIVSLAATLATLPLTALYFGRVSLVTLAVNLLIVPVQPLVLILGGLAGFFAFVLPAFAAFLFSGVFLVLAYTIDIVRAFAGLPFAQVEVDLHRHTVAVVFGIAVVLASARAAYPHSFQRAWAWLGQHRLLSLIGLALAGMMLYGAAYWRSLPDGRLHVWLLDVGHAHAALIQTPGGAHILIDGGRTPTRLLTLMGDRMPFHKRELDLVAITHPDMNDTAALSEVARRFTIRQALTNGQPNLRPEYTALLDAIGADRITPGTAGYTLDLSDGVRLEVLNPLIPPALGDRFTETALVLRLTYDQFSILFPSDLGADGQTALLDANADVRAAVLVLPRHGMENALEPRFWAAVNPSAALLQFDPANRDGAPTPDTLETVGAVPFYRTDQGGTIHLISDGVNVWQSYERD